MGSNHPSKGPKISGGIYNKEFLNTHEIINKNHFEMLYVIGKGGFGKVWKVKYKKNSKFYALKEMSKVKVLDKKSERSIMYEKLLLSNLRHTFIINMHYAFQDHENLYLVMDLLNGGDLRYHISRYKRFTEEQTRFFIACIVLGLEYIHNNGIIHRDIKPENLVLDERGYVRITDFGVAKLYERENSSETSGTPGYMSPEVMWGQNHTHAVDYFALGVICYEFMNGKRPYLGRSRKEIKEQILAKQVQIKPDEKPDDWSNEAVDFINRSLQRKASNRLGVKGPQEVKEHPWLINFPWNKLYDKTLESPFIPRLGDNFDKKYCEMQDKLGNDTKERYEKCLQLENYSNVFREFTCFNTESFDYLNDTNGNIRIINTESLSNFNDNKSVKKKYDNNTQVKLQNQAFINKIKNVNLYVNKINKANISSNIKNLKNLSNLSNTNKANIINNLNNVNNNLNNFMSNNVNLVKTSAHKASISAINLEKAKLSLNKKPVASINLTNARMYLETPEINKVPLLKSTTKSNFNTKINSIGLEKNKPNTNTNNLLGKQINHMSISTNTNNSSNSNISNIPTNYKIRPKEKRTNSMAGISSPIGIMNILYKQKEPILRSSLNYNSEAIFTNNIKRKQNSCEINLDEYERFKLSKMIQKNPQMTSTSSNLLVNNHMRNNSNTNYNTFNSKTNSISSSIDKSYKPASKLK